MTLRVGTRLLMGEDVETGEQFQDAEIVEVDEWGR